MKGPVLALLLAGCAAPAPAPALAPSRAPVQAVAAPVPVDPGLLAAARESRLLAKTAADAGDGTTAQLHLLDARTAVERHLAAAPGDAEALRESGRIHRDSFRFAEGAAAFRAALERGPARDGETVYDLAYCLAYGGEFAAALPLFEEAGSLLGPVARVAVNTAICEERVGRRADGVARLVRLYAAEVAAGRADGADARLALEKTWDLTVQKRDFEGGVAAFRALAAAHPGRPSPPFMLGNLLAFLGRHAEAADAFAACPLPAARARRAKALSLLGAARRSEADAAVREALAAAADEPETADAAVRTVRTHLEAAEPGTARALAVAAGSALDGDASVAVAEGDAHLAEGKPDLARAAYGRAGDATRVARAALASRRAEIADAPGTPLDPVPPAEVLLGFDEAALYPRPLAGVRFLDGAARFRPGRIFLHLFPDLDGTRWTHVDVRARVEGGPATLAADLSDGYDQMTDAPAGRLRWPETPTVGDAWVTVAIPLRGFEPDAAVRAVGTDLRRLKCLALEFRGAGRVPWIDSIELRDDRSGTVRELAGFDGAWSEAGVLFEGTTAPFTRSIGSADAAMDLLPTGTGPISPAILEDQNGAFDPTMVGRGSGALRIRHGETGYYPSKQGTGGRGFLDGPGWATVRLNPDRDVTAYGALTFLARGEKGGERLRVRLLDAPSLDLEPLIPASRWPRSVFPRAAGGDGTLALGKEWRMFRIPFEAYPEVDFAALAEIRFEVGSEAGNAPGATVLLDEIGLED